MNWVEAAVIVSSYQWQFSPPTDSEFIRIRSELVNYPAKKLYPNYGHICQGNRDYIMDFQRLYPTTTYGQIFRFPNYGIFPLNQRRIGILGQRLWAYGNPPLTWIVHIDTLSIPLLPTLPESEKIELILQILQQKEGGLNLTTSSPKPIPPQLL